MNFKSGKLKYITISLGNTILLLILCYVLNNQPLFTGENLNQYAWMELLKEKTGLSENQDYKDAVFINVAYDKQLVDYCDELGMSVGNVDITDRNKLLQILSMLDSTRQYKYVFLDVRFEKAFKTPVDSALFFKIKNMKNIVIANHSDIELADSILISKSAISEYTSTIVATNFTRYKYLYDQNLSMPLYAYQDITGKSIKKHGFIYTCNGHLCQNSLFLTFPTNGFSEFNQNNEKTFYNLGSDLLDNYSASDIATLTKDRLVFIGDMIEDVHDTYAGLKPGNIITYQAFHALMKDEHIVSWVLLVVLSVVFFSISFSLYSRISIIKKLPLIKNNRSKLLHFIISFLGYASVLFILVVVINLFFNKSVNILIPSLYFAILNLIHKYKETII